MNQAIAYRQPHRALSGAAPRKRPLHRYMLLAFMVAICMPITIAFYAGSLLITPYRIFMIACLPYLMFTLFADRSLKFGPADVLMLAFGLWSVGCILHNISDGTQRAGQYWIETVSAYILARVTLRSVADVLYFLKLVLVASIIAFIIAVPEAITHKKFLLEITSRMTGMHYFEYAPGTDVRLGMRRPQAFFANTILYGVFCASCVAMFWYTAQNNFSRIYKVAVLAIATFFSLSSAPLLAVNVQIVMIIGEYLTRGIKGRAPLTISLGVIVTVLMNLLTTSGVVGFIVNHLTFNSGSAYNRVNIWNWGWFNIKQHPIFGLDADNWIRPTWMKPSCDNFWIVITMLGGIPALTFMILTMLITMWKLGHIDVRRLPPIYAKLRMGWFFSFIALAFTGFSVMFFGAISPMYYFMIGIGGALIPIYDRANRLARDR